MTSASEFIPWPRSRSLGQTLVKGRIMKLEWNKLFAEATEKDTKEGKDFELDDGECQECECELSETEHDKNDENENNENNPETPLNLCYKSNTVPNMSTHLDLSEHSLEFPTLKKPVEHKRCSTSKQDTASDIPNNNNNKDYPIMNKHMTIGAMPSGKELLHKRSDDENIEVNKLGKVGTTPGLKSRTPMKEINNLEHNVILENKKMYSGIDQHCSVTDKEQNIQLGGSSNNCFAVESQKIQQNNMKNVEMRSEKCDSGSGTDQPDGKNQKSIKNEQKSKQNCEVGNQVRFAVPAVPEKVRNVGKTIVINGKPYQILAPLGKGGSSFVYLVLNSDNDLLAVKCVMLSGVAESVKNDYLNEIQHLMRMQHSKHVIRLFDHQYLANQKVLYAVMEKGDTDLSRFLKDKAASEEGITPELILYYWNEMLLAVKSIHDNNIIHRDLKPANFLLVSGRLKLIDFGIASSIQNEQTSILMDTQSGTFNYMSPEALMDLGSGNEVVLKIGRKSDVWSLGCILYYFLYKKTPFQDIVKPLQKMRAITDPKYVIKFPKLPGVPDILIESCSRCLVHDRKKRASIEELLDLKNRPLLTLSQVLTKLKLTLSDAEYARAEKALAEEIDDD